MLIINKINFRLDAPINPTEIVAVVESAYIYKFSIQGGVNLGHHLTLKRSSVK